MPRLYNHIIMAKALFNSPRYKTSIISKNRFVAYCCLAFFALGVLSAIIFLEPLFLAIGFAIAFYSLAFSGSFYSEKKFIYKPYLKALQTQQNLFYVEGKKSYVADWEDVKSPNFQYELTLRLLAIIMKADKEERVVEMERVNLYIYNNSDQLISDRSKFKEYLKEDYSVEDVAFTMYWYSELYGKETIYSQIRRDALDVMIEIAYADGDFCEAEEYMLRYVAYHMHLTDNDYEKALIRFINRNFKEEAQEKYQEYKKVRHKRDGGYWYRDRYGNKKWHEIPKEEGEDSEKSQESENAPHIPTEIEKAFALLGMPVDATPSEINACKRNLMRRNHPDLVAYKGQEAVAAATSKCQAINQAYELLKANGKC